MNLMMARAACFKFRDSANFGHRRASFVTRIIFSTLSTRRTLKTRPRRRVCAGQWRGTRGARESSSNATDLIARKQINGNGTNQIHKEERLNIVLSNLRWTRFLFTLGSLVGRDKVERDICRNFQLNRARLPARTEQKETIYCDIEIKEKGSLYWDECYLERQKNANIEH